MSCSVIDCPIQIAPYDLDLNKTVDTMRENEYKLYSNIKFAERYKALSDNFRTENELICSNDVVLQIIKEIGYDAKFIKKNSFFTIEEKEANIKFYININLKYSVSELIIGATDIEKDQFIIEGPFGALYKDLKYQEGIVLENGIKKPAFENYSQLKEILTTALSIYEDFKNEVLML